MFLLLLFYIVWLKIILVIQKYHFYNIIEFIDYYSLYLLYNSNATKPPNTWAKQYGINSDVGNLPADAITIDTAGLIYPPEILLVSKITSAKAAPIARGFPVAKIT